MRYSITISSPVVVDVFDIEFGFALKPCNKDILNKIKNNFKNITPDKKFQNVIF